MQNILLSVEIARPVSAVFTALNTETKWKQTAVCIYPAMLQQAKEGLCTPPDCPSLQHNKHGVSQAFAAGRLWKRLQETGGTSLQDSQFSHTRMSASQELIVLHTLLFRKCWLSTSMPTMEDFRAPSSFPTNTSSLLPRNSTPDNRPDSPLFCDHSG